MLHFLNYFVRMLLLDCRKTKKSRIKNLLQQYLCAQSVPASQGQMLRWRASTISPYCLRRAALHLPLRRSERGLLYFHRGLLEDRNAYKASYKAQSPLVGFKRLVPIFNSQSRYFRKIMRIERCKNKPMQACSGRYHKVNYRFGLAPATHICR